MKSTELKQQRSDILDKIKGILNTAKAEERSITSEERSQIEGFKSQAETLLADINTAEMLEKEEERKAAQVAHQRSNTEVKEKKEIVKRFSFLRAIRMASENKPLDGIEAEMYQEATKEARESGLTLSGNVRVPAFMKRDLTAGTNTQGGHTVETDVGDLIPFLQPRLQVEALGATVMSGLIGDLSLPRNDGNASATWVAENASNSETSPTLDAINLSPNRLGAFTDISKQLMVQSSIQVENFVRGLLERAIANALDLAAINGSGSSNQPTGILNTSGIGDVAGGSDGAAPTFANIIALETEVATDNADMGALNYLTTPGIRGLLKGTTKDAGSGQFVWGSDNTLNGYNAAVSTQIPSNLTKGSGTDLHAIIFGNFNDLIIAQWGGYDLVIDPYTGAKQALITLVANSWWDVALRHPESFAAMKDAIVA